jgi:hypothetical protein
MGYSKTRTNAQMQADANRRSKAENAAAHKDAGNFSLNLNPDPVYPVVRTLPTAPRTTPLPSGKSWKPRGSR